MAQTEFRHCLLAIFFAFLPLMAAYADSWGAPRKEHRSANEKWSLILGHGGGGKTLSLCERTDDGLKVHWRRGYVHPIWPPHRAYVTDDGKYVVLRDVYHNLGYHKVIVILDDHGKVLGSYELGDFLPQDEIMNARHSVSSIWWNENAWFSFVEDDKRFALVTQHGTVRCFDLPTGKLLDLTAEDRKTVVDLVRPLANEWVVSDEAHDRIRGIRMLAGLQVSETRALATRLFQDKTPTGSVGRGGKPGARIYGVQKAAAEALCRTMGADAIPLLEKELADANWYMKEALLEVLSQIDKKGLEIVNTPETPALIQAWKRLAEHPSEDVRFFSVCQVLYRDDGSYLLARPELIESQNDMVRAVAVHQLAKVDSPAAGQLLRKSTSDRDDSIRQSALRHLVARDPDDVEDILLLHLDDDSVSIRLDVMIELVSRGNLRAADSMRSTIESWNDEIFQGDDKWVRRREVEKLCKLVADLKLDEMRDSLVAVRAVSEPILSVYVMGALSALGDERARMQLHQQCRDGKDYPQILAVEMCRYLDDSESVRIVTDAVNGTRRDLRAAATKKLSRFQDRRRLPDEK